VCLWHMLRAIQKLRLVSPLYERASFRLRCETDHRQPVLQRQNRPKSPVEQQRLPDDVGQTVAVKVD
jgi:hypothetical protein